MVKGSAGKTEKEERLEREKVEVNDSRIRAIYILKREEDAGKGTELRKRRERKEGIARPID